MPGIGGGAFVQAGGGGGGQFVPAVGGGAFVPGGRGGQLVPGAGGGAFVQVGGGGALVMPAGGPPGPGCGRGVRARTVAQSSPPSAAINANMLIFFI